MSATTNEDTTDAPKDTPSGPHEVAVDATPGGRGAGRPPRFLTSALLIRSRMWWALPAAAGLLIFAATDRGAPWRGELAWGIEFVGAIHLFVLPVFAATAAWDGIPWGRLESLALAPRRRVAPLLWLATTAAPALLLQLLACAAIAVTSLTAGHIGTTPWLPMLNQLLAVVVAASVGLAVGFRWPRLPALLAAFTVLFIATAADYGSYLPLGLMGDGSTGTLVGLHPDPANQLLRALFSIAVIACAVLAMQPRQTPGATRGTVRHPTHRQVAWCAAITFVAIACVGLAARPDSYLPGAPLEATSCTRATPTFCTLPEWSSSRAEGARRIALARAVLDRWGVQGGPETYVAWWPTAPKNVASVRLIRPDFATKLVPVQDTVMDVIAPQDCAFWSAQTAPRLDAQVAREALTYLAIRSEPRLGTASEPVVPMSVFLQLPADQQAAYVRQAATALAACQPDQVPPLPGTGR